MTTVQLITLLIPFAFIAFWGWMFHDMVNNYDIPGQGSSRLVWPPETKNQWLAFFIILNIFTAGYYYFTQYRNR